jgi:hypothetical protein
MRAKSFGKIAWFDHIMLLKHEMVKSCYFCLSRLTGFVMVSETGLTDSKNNKKNLNTVKIKRLNKIFNI